MRFSDLSKYSQKSQAQSPTPHLVFQNSLFSKQAQLHCCNFKQEKTVRCLTFLKKVTDHSFHIHQCDHWPPLVQLGHNDWTYKMDLLNKNGEGKNRKPKKVLGHYKDYETYTVYSISKISLQIFIKSIADRVMGRFHNHGKYHRSEPKCLHVFSLLNRATKPKKI